MGLLLLSIVSYLHSTAATALTLRHNASHGLHVHLVKPRRDTGKLAASKEFVQISESRSTKVFMNQVIPCAARSTTSLNSYVLVQEWVSLGNSILETILSISNAEKEAFLVLRKEV